ncbi:MAG: orotidine-5'-phosphate decarboxylase [Bifidobacterium tibiigranuli]|jgi:orotidine-5'-phosphate decarboxylase|uniref:orotidine-5'-phosphate decarboxylase n=2 Tax=Bifidobacterium tibiigranuli TaxID=2172043 RepID=UPI0026EC368A|nr:orotidine-5'-phosphate decarboxylase [Bifidobacterium tibiigranuli]MCI1649704.1 orotidine-5'-phosphate decarboxylase [Bifidobacterium tibiigranuli]MCI2185454.1 orotidine-5'-phosphate decarboxylase [Bifidobacterium tibiigranuli]MCI2203571.1 orotidine-5'-phosphate decarboxylase [Bifidobacterium tibiigranuli]
MDRLIAAIKAMQNPSVVGLDPTVALVPPQVFDAVGDDLDAAGDKASAGYDASESGAQRAASRLALGYFEFNRAVIDAVADIVPAVKVQVAMYEALGPAGIDAYTMTCEYAQQQGLYVIGDIKRGDIGSTAAAYAQHLSGLPQTAIPSADSAHKDGSYDDLWHEDAVTVNPYLGADGITPFVDAAKQTDKGIFVLVRTSNPSSKDIQELELASGERFYEHVADLVSNWGSDSLGAEGYSRVGAVVGATHPQEGQALRERMPHTFFLVPGFGAQGGTAQDVAGMFDADGSGAIVNSSRGIIAAWKKSGEYRSGMSADEALDLVASAARRAAINMRDELRVAVYR